VSRAFQELIEALASEAVAFEELVGWCRAERDLLVSGDVPALNENLARQRDVLARLGEVEVRRRGALDGWRDGLAGPVPGPAPGLREVIALAPPEAAVELRKLHERLTGAGEELRRLARSNYFLAMKGLEFVDATVRIIAGGVLGAGSSTYAAAGQPTPVSGRAMLVDRTV
jgi:hypothetical protein